VSKTLALACVRLFAASNRGPDLGQGSRPESKAARDREAAF
jgi:hypothetical protein